MIYFVDGPQLAGKSSLIDDLVKNKNFKKFKFEFGKYSKLFDIKGKKSITHFQIGKDLASLYWIDKINQEENILIDRGIISSIYYSMLLNRMNQENISKYFDIMEEYKNFKYIFIFPKNNLKMVRNKNDGFDNLSKKQDFKILNYIEKELKKRNIYFKVFYNDFNKSINQNSEELYNIIKEKL